MGKITIDIWGQIRGKSPTYRVHPPYTAEVDAPADSSDGVVYRRFFDETPCAIHRDTLTTANNRTDVKTEVAYDSWSNRASATYKPVNNNAIDVYQQDITASNQTISCVKGTAISSTTLTATLRYANPGAITFSGDVIAGLTMTAGGVITGTPDADAGTYPCRITCTAPNADPVYFTLTFTVTE